MLLPPKLFSKLKFLAVARPPVTKFSYCIVSMVGDVYDLPVHVSFLLLTPVFFPFGGRLAIGKNL